jgi:acetyl esterase/lipase
MDDFEVIEDKNPQQVSPSKKEELRPALSLDQPVTQFGANNSVLTPGTRDDDSAAPAKSPLKTESRTSTTGNKVREKTEKKSVSVKKRTKARSKKKSTAGSKNEKRSAQSAPASVPVAKSLEAAESTQNVAPKGDVQASPPPKGKVNDLDNRPRSRKPKTKHTSPPRSRVSVDKKASQIKPALASGGGARSNDSSSVKYLQEVLVDDRQVTWLGRGTKLGLRILKPTVFNGFTLPWVKRLSIKCASIPLSYAKEVAIEPFENTLPVKGQLIAPSGCSDSTALLHFHGGNYEIGGSALHAKFVSHLAKAINTKAYLPDYRLAPRHPYPAAVDDCYATYVALVEQHGAENLLVSGDSAGGGLAVSVLARAKLMGLPMPKKLVLFSPWLDFKVEGDSFKTHSLRDPVLSSHCMESSVRRYFGMGLFRRPDDAHLEAASPLNEVLSDFPPTLIQVGTEEVLLSDANRLAKKLESSQVKTRLEIWAGLWHGWHYLNYLPESKDALEHVSAFMGYQ